jgi:hypothetical protein
MAAEPTSLDRDAGGLNRGSIQPAWSRRQPIVKPGAGSSRFPGPALQRGSTNRE